MLVWLVSTAVATLEIRAELQTVLDAHLEQNASLLLAQAGAESDEIELNQISGHGLNVPSVVFQIWEDGKTLVTRSSNAPAVQLAERKPGFSDAWLDNRKWRVYGAWDADRHYLVQVGESAEAREHLYLEALEYLLWPLLFALPVFALVIWWSVGAALEPVGRIASELAGRDSNNLMPIAGPVPVEISPMVRRLNSLLARVQSSLESERRFTSDAAHELRTPLAAIKAQLQVALGASNGQGRELAITNAIKASDSATRLVEQLLTLARLEHDAWKTRAEGLNLYSLTAEVMAELAPAALEKNISLSLDGATDAVVEGHAGLLSILVRNLLDNAIRYSPAMTQISVAIHQSAEGVCLEVADQGAGIDAENREKAVQRFHRLSPSAAAGSGLGLSIVARIADLHQAQFVLADNPGGGLKAMTTFRVLPLDHMHVV